MIRKIFKKAAKQFAMASRSIDLYDLEVHKEFSRRQANHPNPLNKSALSGFAQTDEDGITLEILRRIGLSNGYFIEFGVGDGLENNTIILLAGGWRGAWFGGQELAVDTSNSAKLHFERVWITKENIADLYQSAEQPADVISLDLDGNDIYLAETLLQAGARPKLFIVEYNGKFPPPIEFQIAYDETHNWQGDDYFGASLCSFQTVFNRHDYTLVCCNISGANAFFVHNSELDKFNDIPRATEELYCAPFYFLRQKKMHPTAVKTVQLLINGGSQTPE